MAFNFTQFLKDLLKALGTTPSPTPPAPIPPAPQPPTPTTRIVAATVTGGASGVLRLDNGDTYTATASPTGRIEFTIPYDRSGGGDLTLSLAGYVGWTSHVALNSELTDVPVQMELAKKPLPPIPTRGQVCAIKMSFQGLTYHTRDYGAMPGVFFWTSYADRATSVFPVHRAAGDTHMVVGICGSYNEPNTIWPPEITKGGDSTDDLPAFKALIREVIMEGFFAHVTLSGDGDSVRSDGSIIRKGEYNDPIGSTYGYEWLMQNLARILKAIRGDRDSECPDGEDLTPYCIVAPGFDGVFYGWSEPNKVKLDAFGKLFRSVLPGGYLAIEHSTGHIPAGEALGDWEPGGCMYHYDTLLSEFDSPLAHNDNVWQIAARTLGPVARGGTYVRPSDQPATDDPGTPPWYLHSGGVNGPYFVVAFEYDTYHWSRGQISLDQVEKDRAYLKSVGYRIVC